MNTKAAAIITIAIATITLGTPDALAKRKNQEPQIPLTEVGERLQQQYSKQREDLKGELDRLIPQPAAHAKKDYLDARHAEQEAVTRLQKAEQDLGAIKRGQGLVAHAKGKWIGSAEKGIQKAKAKIKAASSAEEREAAKKELAKWEENLKAGQQALKERQAQLDEALKNKSKLERNLEEAKEALAHARQETLEALDDLGLARTLGSDKLDGKLAKFVVLSEATPRALAAYAQEGRDQFKLVEDALANEQLLVQMAVADGAKDGNWAQAFEIYSRILKTSDKAAEGTLNRLAIAVSLEHAKPIKQRNAVADTDAPATVDPVNRYRHYEQAFLAGELDPAFKNLTIWDMRMVVDGEEPDKIIAWGREMLRNYRPDHITTDDYRWRYVALVRSDIRYGSQDNQYDQDELHFFQNVLKNGGICGRRAFIGRFILRAFGIPTIARPQRAHAALAHWTPDGWVVCLGGGWGAGWTKTRYDRGLDFLANTQARAAGDAFMQVKRAQWIGDVAGEPRVFGLLGRGTPGFWYGISLYTQRAINAASKARTLAAVGEDIGEANETKEHVEINTVEMTEADRKPTIDSNGVITIPSSATTSPTMSTRKIIFMNSVLGGKQLHYSRTGGEEEFSYSFSAPASGRYQLTARVATPSWKQNLLVKANHNEAVTLPLPHTVGRWESTEPVVVELKRGRNTLSFAHTTDGQAKGFTIKDFTLKPVN